MVILHANVQLAELGKIPIMSWYCTSIHTLLWGDIRQLVETDWSSLKA